MFSGVARYLKITVLTKLNHKSVCFASLLKEKVCVCLVFFFIFLQIFEKELKLHKRIGVEITDTFVIQI